MEIVYRLISVKYRDVFCERYKENVIKSNKIIEKPAGRQVFHRFGLFLGDRSDRALRGAGAAADASVGDLKLAAGIFNCFDGALRSAGAAADACICDFKSHM